MQDISQDLESSGPPTDVVAPDVSLDPIHTLAENLAADMADAWRRGRQVCAEDHFQRHPELLDCRQAAFRLICEEICLRQEAGLNIEKDKFLERFPQWHTEIQLLLECHELLQPELGMPPVSPTGPILDDFHSLAELGHGAQGRVFLARQLSLGDRPVVLKVTARHGREHLSLARLQHTHIAPLYWVHDDPARDQRILCMPFFGTVTLAELLSALKDKPPSERSGKDLLEVLDGAQAKLLVDLPGQGPARPFLARATFPQAMCWIGGCLADALQYAHDRGLCHLDLKPSNILLAGDGQPMLLDFHLAREPISPSHPRLEGIGGTPMYMSPEQRALVAAICDRKPITVSVDGRSDVYSLGLILYQLLGGPVPLPVPAPRLESCNPAVSTGLADILHKCIAARAEDRYRTAAALAADFRRHLADQRLRGVPNRNWRELWGKWRRRRPHALPIAILTCLVLAMALGALGFLYRHDQVQKRERLHALAERLRQAQGLMQNQRYEEAINTLNSGVKLAEDAGAAELAQRLKDQLALATLKHKAAALHAIADDLRFKSSGPVAPRALAALEKNCRELWDNRNRILAIFKERAETALQQQVRTDLLDLAVIWSSLQHRQAGTNAAADHRAALDVLAEAEKLFGSNPVLQRERFLHASALKLNREAHAAAEASERQPPETAWEHYALGRSYLLAGDLEHAATYLDRAVDLDPGGFWPNFYQGICAYRRGKYQDAVSAFRAALTASPKVAVAYYNRGLAYSRISNREHALSDYSQALRLNPNLAEAALNRGLVYFQQKDYHKAGADLKYALAEGSDPATTHYNLALVYLAQKKRADALSHARLALQFQPDYGEARELASKLQRD